jgi:hypothetical protein
VADSVDIPDDLLRLMDVRAKSRGLTRDRLIVEVLRRSCGASVGDSADSDPEGVCRSPVAEQLRKAQTQGTEAQRAVEDLAHALRRRHRSDLTTG